MNMDDVADRSLARVRERLSDDAPCKAPNGGVCCPFCGQRLTVRRTVLGRLDELPSGRRPHIDGVQLKCAGDAGCAFRPDFDVPITPAEWQRERARRDGQRVVDRGYTPGNGVGLQERLRALGYLPEIQ